MDGPAGGIRVRVRGDTEGRRRTKVGILVEGHGYGTSNGTRARSRGRKVMHFVLGWAEGWPECELGLHLARGGFKSRGGSPGNGGMVRPVWARHRQRRLLGWANNPLARPA